MTLWTLVKRSLRFRARSHLGVMLGAAVGTAALAGALLVGDSVRGTLIQRALDRLGNTHYAIQGFDRFFKVDLKSRLCERTKTESTNAGQSPGAATLRASSACPLAVALMLPGLAVNQDGSARANLINVMGVEPAAWSQLASWNNPVTPTGSRIEEAELEAWKAGQTALLNRALARQLSVKPGDEILVRIRKPSALGADAVITPKDQDTVALRLGVGPILDAERLGDFSLAAHQTPPPNLFLPLEFLAQRAGIEGRANLLLNGPILTQPGARSPTPLDANGALPGLAEALRDHWQLEDGELALREVELPSAAAAGESARRFVEVASSRIFLEDTVVSAALTPRTNLLRFREDSVDDSAEDLVLAQFVTNGVQILTYVANLIYTGTRSTPYSMVTAASGDLVPVDLRDDEIIVNDWLAEDLAVQPGDSLKLSYYVVDSASRLTERTNSFRVRAIVPMKGVYADRTLMPEFPGLAKAESTHDWDTGFPLVYTIRPKDEAYWKEHRGTPKAYVTLAAGQQMWANRFGSLTAIRYAVPTDSLRGKMLEAAGRNLLANLEPADFGLVYQPVREQALRAATQAQDFGQLFLGFSIFLVVAAVLLMALLFQFGVEQRAQEVGTLLAIGFTPSRVRRLLLLEGIMLASAGGLLGLGLGMGYAKAMLWALTTVWRDAIGTEALEFHATQASLVAGLIAAILIATGTLWLALRRQARQPARELLASGDGTSRLPPLTSPRTARNLGQWICVAGTIAGVLIVGMALVRGDTTNAGAFFGAGALLLLAGLGGAAAWTRSLIKTGVNAAGSSGHPHLVTLAVRGISRRRSRSVATIALLASGCFVVVSLGVFRQDAARDAGKRSSGTGGFALLGEAALPVIQDLQTAAGLEAFGLDAKDLPGVSIIPFRVRQGDEASCLNLNRAQKPRLLGVRPELLEGRFTFTRVAKELERAKGWELLRARATQPSLGEAGNSEEVVPAIGDANSVQWALGRKVGDLLDYTDERGRTFKIRLVGAVANSILQGSLVIDEQQFLKRFPGESGYRFFLVDAPLNSATYLTATLSRAFSDVGLQITAASDRLNAFNAVQNTYLGTFQVLGGLGLLLGSAGLGIVVLRNVLERRAELAVFLAVGFRRRQVQQFVLMEHALLLAVGLGLGCLAAVVAVLPALLVPGAGLPWPSLSITLAGVLTNGAFCTWAATRYATSGELLEALRNE